MNFQINPFFPPHYLAARKFIDKNRLPNKIKLTSEDGYTFWYNGFLSRKLTGEREYFDKKYLKQRFNDTFKDTLSPNVINLLNSKFWNIL